MYNTREIVAGLEGWLNDEIINSHVGRNQILDNWQQLREDIGKNVTDPTNQDSRKYTGHVHRFNILMTAVDADTLATNDFATGKAIHHSLMFVSGGFRKACALRAANQEEYEDMRLRGPQPLSTNLRQAIIKAKVGFAEDGVSFESLLNRATFLSGRVLRRHSSMNDWMQINPRELLQPQAVTSVPVEKANDIQSAGIELAGRLILFAAQVRKGGLAAVPILEPKSISDVSKRPIYPFEA